MLPSIVPMLLCIMLWIGLFHVPLSDKQNTLLGSLPRYGTIYVRRIPSLRGLERNTDYFYRQFSNTINLSKLPLNLTFLTWLKPIDDSSETKATKFWEHMFSFRKNKSALIQLQLLLMMILVMSLKFMVSSFIQVLVALQNRLFQYQFFLILYC
jgi:hypothetical protein